MSPRLSGPLFIALYCVRIRYSFTTFSDDGKLYDNEILTIFIRNLFVLHDALYLPGIRSTSAFQPFFADNRRLIFIICIYYHRHISLYAACLRFFHAFVAETVVLPVVHVSRLA